LSELGSRARNERSKIRASQSVSVARLELQEKLEAGLESLKQTLSLGYELSVKWVPNSGGKLAGEVKKNCIHVYEKTEKEALDALTHEFLDYAISNIVEPYKQVTNK